MVVSLLFILLLRYTADVLLWLLIFGVIAAIGYGENAPHMASGHCIFLGDVTPFFFKSPSL